MNSSNKNEVKEMKYEGKDLYVLIWNENIGKYDKVILNPSLKQNVKGEFHTILRHKVGEL